VLYLNNLQASALLDCRFPTAGQRLRKFVPAKFVDARKRKPRARAQQIRSDKKAGRYTMKVLIGLALAGAVIVLAGSVAPPSAEAACRPNDANCRNRSLNSVSYDLDNLMACIQKVRKELNDWRNPGNGPKYYAKLRGCKGEARRVGSEIADLNEASAECNEACADRTINRAMH
jgi:hypothetical protein